MSSSSEVIEHNIVVGRGVIWTPILNRVRTVRQKILYIIFPNVPMIMIFYALLLITKLVISKYFDIMFIFILGVNIY